MGKEKPRDVDSYIEDSVTESHSILRELRALTTSTVPEAQEGIAWNVPIYKYHGILAGFATYKKHVSFGVGAEGFQPKDRKLLEEQGYKTGKGTVQIKFNQKVPVDILRNLLQVQAEINETKESTK